MKTIAEAILEAVKNAPGCVLVAYTPLVTTEGRESEFLDHSQRRHNANNHTSERASEGTHQDKEPPIIRSIPLLVQLQRHVISQGHEGARRFVKDLSDAQWAKLQLELRDAGCNEWLIGFLTLSRISERAQEAQEV